MMILYDYRVDSVEIFLANVAAVANLRREASMRVTIHARHSTTCITKVERVCVCGEGVSAMAVLTRYIFCARCISN